MSNTVTTTRKVVFIMGSGHCGSTLLDLLLGSHSDAFSLGEIHRLGTALDDPTRKTLCGVCAERCEFWDERVPLRALEAIYSNRTPLHRVVRKLAHATVNPYRLLMDWSGRSVLIDSSKSRSWIDRQLRPRHKWRHITPYLLFLGRDGRAIVNSYHQKYPERSYEQLVLDWAKGIQSMERYFETFPTNRKLYVSYEQLARSPERTLQRICGSLGLRFEAPMLRYWEHDHHHVFGNGGTRSLIWRYRQQFAAPSPALEARAESAKQHYRHEYYDQVDVAIKLDERWRRELTEEELRTFERLAGCANATYAADTALAS